MRLCIIYINCLTFNCHHNLLVYYSASHTGHLSECNPRLNSISQLRHLPKAHFNLAVGISLPSLSLNLSLARSVESLELGSSETQNTILLVITQPRLLRITEHATGNKIHELTNDDKNKGNRVQEVDLVTKDPNTDDDTPEVGSQQRNVEESRTSHTEHDGHEDVEDVQAKSVTDDPADNLTVPGCVIERVSVKDGSLDTVDTHTKQAQERQDVVQVSPGHEPLLEYIGSTVESGTKQSKQITLDHIKAAAAIGTADVITGNENTHTTTADHNTNDLKDSVPNLEQEERNDNNADNSPKVNKLRRQDVRVSVRQNSEVVSLDVQKRHDEVLPPILHSNAPPALDAVLPKKNRRVDEEHEDVVEDGLERGNVGARICEEAGEGVGGRDAQRKNLAQCEDDPEVEGGQVAVPMNGLDLEGVDALADGGIFVCGDGGLGSVGGWALGVALGGGVLGGVDGDGLSSRHDDRFIRGVSSKYLSIN